jgi:hypothetical protein
VLNILPGVAAGPYSEDGHSLALARLIRSLFGLVGLAGFLWVVWEVVCWYWPGRPLPVFRLVLLAVIALEGVLYYNASWTIMGPFRDAAFYAPLALVLRWLRQERVSPLRDLGYGLVLGALTTAGLLVSYERGSSWPLVLGFAILFGLLTRGLSAGRLLVGVGLGAAGAAWAIGTGPLSEALGQAAYWAKHGSAMFALVPDLAELIASPYLLGQLLVVFAVLSWVVRDFFLCQGSFREWLREQGPLHLLLLVAGLTLRRALARCDLPHYQMAGMPVVLVLAGLGLLLARRHATEDWPRWLALANEQLERPAVAVLVAGLLAITHPNCLPAGPTAYALDWAPNRAKVLTPTRDVLAAIGQLGPLGPGEFYTLDSAGAWYYLLSVSSPSKYHQAVYALPADSQRQLVADLERHRTRVVLVPPDSYRFDGVATRDLFPIVQDYLETHYTPKDGPHGYRLLVRKETLSTEAQRHSNE